MSDEEKPVNPQFKIGDQPVVVELLDDRLKRIALIIGIMVIAAGAIGGIILVWPVISLVVNTLLPFAVGLVFAYIFDPIVTFVQRRLKLSRIGGVLVLYGIFIIAITAFFAMVLPILITQIRNAGQGISGFAAERLVWLQNQISGQESQAIEGQEVTLVTVWQQTLVWLETQGIRVEEMFSQAAESEEVRTAAKSAATSGLRVVGEAIAFFFGFVSRILGGVMFLVFAILVNIYLLLDFSKLRNLLSVMIPVAHRERTFVVLGKLDIAVGGFIRGTLIVACIVGTLTFVGLYLLGLREYALLIGIIAGVGNMVPYLGAISGMTPALLYVVFSDAYATLQERLIYGVGVLALFGVIQAIEGFLLQPKIVGQSAQLHPIAVLLALALGANFGILGMILAVPLACIIRVLVKEFYWDSREDAWREQTGANGLGDIDWEKR